MCKTEDKHLVYGLSGQLYVFNLLHVIQSLTCSALKLEFKLYSAKINIKPPLNYITNFAHYLNNLNGCTLPK